MHKKLSEAWQALNQRTIGYEDYWSIALQNASFYQDMQPLIDQYVRGRTLDIGAGQLAWRSELARRSTWYTSGDIAREHPDLDVIFDATRPLPFADEQFDTLFSASVLEHTRDPWQAMREMRRVLRPGGIAIVAIPFLFYLHGQPHDYYRFTRYGAIDMAKQAGFDIIEVVTNGGIAYQACNIPSVLISTVLFGTGLYGAIRPTTAMFESLARTLDHYCDPEGLFAAIHMLVLRNGRG